MSSKLTSKPAGKPGTKAQAHLDFNRKYPIDFVKHRKKSFIFSIAITVLGIITLLVFGLNYGVDFRAGTSLDISVGQSADIAKVDEIFTQSGFVPDTRNIGGDNNDRITARFKSILSTDDIGKIMAGFKTAYGDKVSHEENTVDPAIALELKNKAILAVAVASIAIIIYVSIRFEWRFAVAAIVALLHDAFIVVSIFSILRLEVNLPFVAAILTIIGYSINDTIVIFDRIRENLRFARLKSFDDLSNLVNASIWQTMSRSINTMITVLIASFFLLVFGSESIRLFSLAMTLGLISGAYSSVLIASPLWIILKNKSLNKKPIGPQAA